MFGRWIICYAVCLHLCWAVALCFSPDAMGITALRDLAFLLTRWPAALVLLTVGVLAFIGLFHDPGRKAILLILPQQLVLVTSAFAALSCMIAGAFADGVQRGRWFIVADQSPAILGALFHTCAIVEFHAPGAVGASWKAGRSLWRHWWYR